MNYLFTLHRRKRFWSGLPELRMSFEAEGNSPDEAFRSVTGTTIAGAYDHHFFAAPLDGIDVAIACQYPRDWRLHDPQKELLDAARLRVTR